MDTEHVYTNRSQEEGQTQRTLLKEVFQGRNLGSLEIGQDINQIYGPQRSDVRQNENIQ